MISLDAEKAESSSSEILPRYSIHDVPSRGFKQSVVRILGWSILILSGGSAISQLWNDTTSTLQHSPRWGEEVTFCQDAVNWTALPSSGDTAHWTSSFDLPLTKESIYLESHGDFAFGSVEVSATAPPDSNHAIVEIDMFSPHPSPFDGVKTCRTHNNEKWGLGIFTPTKPRWPWGKTGSSRRFHVHLRVPAPTSERPRQLQGLHMILPSFSYVLQDLSDVQFENVFLLASKQTFVYAESLAARVLSVIGRGASIEGTFNASLWLNLASESDDLNVRANLLNEQSCDGPVRAQLYTDHAPLYGTVNLHSNCTDGSAGAFWVVAETARAPLTLTVADAPVDSQLTLEAKTSWAPASVALPPTYEGRFDLRTNLFFIPELSWRGGVKDPAGFDRQLDLNYERPSRSVHTGSITWRGSSGGGAKRGRVIVSTMGERVKLTLGGLVDHYRDSLVCAAMLRFFDRRCE